MVSEMDNAIGTYAGLISTEINQGQNRVTYGDIIGVDGRITACFVDRNEPDLVCAL